MVWGIIQNSQILQRVLDQKWKMNPSLQIKWTLWWFLLMCFGLINCFPFLYQLFLLKWKRILGYLTLSLKFSNAVKSTKFNSLTTLWFIPSIPFSIFFPQLFFIYFFFPFYAKWALLTPLLLSFSWEEDHCPRNIPDSVPDYSCRCYFLSLSWKPVHCFNFYLLS
jgi:hypothetical protein